MSKALKVFQLVFVFFLIVIFGECVAAKQNPYAKKKKQSSHINASQLGRNKLYYSPAYQKKLNKNYKKK